MRKTSELVNEMLTEAKNAWLVAIVVGSDTETKFIFSSARHPLEELNNLIKSGGSPIGLLRFDKEGTGIQGSYRPFEEYADEAWVKEYLAGLLDNAGEIVASWMAGPTFPAAY
ncbi:hypothetical protein [uncultured Methanoregula sp.]|uniref:hypothetical protein n=1 Tax=uncultured Methanoregula sp. TaxID=1005933 RepID=UPI002AAAD571|nr:hypothetical protein [uncultured Methanoregula sp.]